MNREKLLAGIFAGSEQIAGLTLRPFSIGTLTLIREFGLTILGGKEGPLSNWPKERQLLVFLFIQTKPLAEVKAARALLLKPDLSAFEELFFDFEVSIPVSALIDIAGTVDGDLNAITAAQVELADKPGTADSDPPAPPN